MNVRIVNKSKHSLPEYQTAHAAAVDIRANLPDAPLTLTPNEPKLVSTGLYIALPIGFEAQMRPRSGLALKHGVTLCNSPGTIDADYRGEIKIIMINHGKDPFVISDGDRIAQMVVAPVERIIWEETQTLDETSRGEGGFGHTGI